MPQLLKTALAALEAAQDQLSTVVDCDPDLIEDAVLTQVQDAIEALRYSIEAYTIAAAPKE